MLKLKVDKEQIDREELFRKHVMECLIKALDKIIHITSENLKCI